MSESKINGKSVEYEVITCQMDDGENVELDNVQEYMDDHGAQVDRIDFWYEFEDGTREHRTVHGPFDSEGDIEQAIIDGIEFDPSP